MGVCHDIIIVCPVHGDYWVCLGGYGIDQCPILMGVSLGSSGYAMVGMVLLSLLYIYPDTSLLGQSMGITGYSLVGKAWKVCHDGYAMMGMALANVQ